MSAPHGLPPGPEPPRPLASLLRWVVSALLAAGGTLLLFALMVRAIDAGWIVERMVRIFPLEQTALAPGEGECEPPAPVTVEIAGRVGHRSGGVFVPLPDALLLYEDANGPTRQGEVSPMGEFELALAFPRAAPPGCPEPTGGPPRLEVRAPGCASRRVPVTPAWVPHRVLLSCEERRGARGPEVPER